MFRRPKGQKAEGGVLRAKKHAVDPAARFAFWFSVVLMGTAVAAIAVVLVIADRRSLSSLEQLLFQVLILIASLLGAYLFGLHASRKSKEWALRQYARAAFRRVLTLYRSLTRLAELLAREDSEDSEGMASTTLASLRATVVEQLGTIHDALEDWRDIIPQDVRDIEEKLARVSMDWREAGRDD